MTVVYRYVDPMGAFNVDLGNQVVRLGELEGFAETAELGAVGFSHIAFDDPTGTVGHSGDHIVGLKQFQVIENAAPSGKQRIYTGYTGPRRYHRDPRKSAIVGDDRIIDCDLVELNCILQFNVISGDDGERPAESAGDRLTWLLASGYLEAIDNGLVAYPATTMDANDYRGQFPTDVLSDLAMATGYNFFLYYDEAANQVSLWFDDSNTSTNYTADIALSNVLSDINNTTVFSAANGVLHRDPGKVVSGVYLPYANGAFYDTDPATAAAYAPRDRVAPNANVKSAEMAQTQVARMLAENATEDDTVTCSVELPAANVNDIKRGQRVSARFSHLPGYESFFWFRVVKRTVKQIVKTPDRYTLDLELSPSTATVPAAATIFFSNDDNGYSSNNAIVSWRRSGDSDPGDFIDSPLMDPSEALSGSLEYVVGAATPPFATGGGWWNGIRALAAGTLDVYFATDLNLTYSEASPPLVSWEILLNGVVAATYQEVASPSSPCFAGVCGWTPFKGVQTTLNVVAGDVISARVANLNGSPRVIPLGAGDFRNCLVVSGSMFNP